MEDHNNVSVVARLTSDPELRQLQSGTSVCSMRVAFNTSQKNADGSWEDKGNFVNVTVWGGHGETCSKYLHKGSRVAINGRLGSRSWEQDGNTRSEVSITANRVQFLDPKEDRPQPTPPTQGPADTVTDEEAPF